MQGAAAKRLETTLADNDSNPRDGTLSRGWWPYTRVAKDYLHISPDLVREAIHSGDLPAYQKPITRGRKDSARHIVLVCLDDADDWIRSKWPRVTRESWTV